MIYNFSNLLRSQSPKKDNNLKTLVQLQSFQNRLYRETPNKPLKMYSDQQVFIKKKSTKSLRAKENNQMLLKAL